MDTTFENIENFLFKKGMEMATLNADTTILTYAELENMMQLYQKLKNSYKKVLKRS